MSILSALLPTVLAHGIHDRATRQARLLERVDAVARRNADPPAPPDGLSENDGSFDDRTLDQMRADLVADMLLTGAPAIDPTRGSTPGGLGAIRAIVQISVPVTTLTGVTSAGAELDGFVRVDPETARRLAGDAPG